MTLTSEYKKVAPYVHADDRWILIRWMTGCKYRVWEKALLASGPVWG